MLKYINYFNMTKNQAQELLESKQSFLFTLSFIKSIHEARIIRIHETGVLQTFVKLRLSGGKKIWYDVSNIIILDLLKTQPVKTKSFLNGLITITYK